MGFTNENAPYGLFLNLAKISCVVVGGGRVAERKASALLFSGAKLTIISPKLTERLNVWKEEGKFEHIARPYTYGDLRTARLVFAATDHGDVNQQVYEECQEIGAWVNVADRPDLCTFFVPATIHRGDLALAVSTNGANPALAKALRQYLEEMFGNEFADFLDMMRQIRSNVRQNIKQSDKRTAFYRNLLQSDILDHLARGDSAIAEQILAAKMGEWLTMKQLRVGTRQSQLALTQTNWVCEQITRMQPDLHIDTVKIVTKGDRILDVALSKVGGKGLFIKEIEQALLDETVDFAVHSMKDMPAEMPEGLMIAAVPSREDVRDVVITKDGRAFADLQPGAVVGTSSLRRSIQLKAARPDLKIVPLRGNIDTRLRKLQDEAEGLDAIVLAAAGLERMGWAGQITERLPIELCIPAVGQGALAIQCRSQDTFTREILAGMNDTRTEKAVLAERTFLARLNGGCQIPIGAHARFLADDDEMLEMTAIVGDVTGEKLIRVTAVDKDPVQLGHTVADQLFAQGAREILASVREELNRS